MQLATFIQNYVDASSRLERDFTGPRGWVHLTNLALKRYEGKGWFRLDRLKEVGVEVQNSYWITIPSDMRKPSVIFAPPFSDYRQSEKEYSFEIVNKKIKLKTPFDKKTDPDDFTLSSWGSDSVNINNATAEEDDYKDHLLVVTNGDLIGKCILIAGNSAANGGLTELNFYHSDGSGTATSTEGYITDKYLMFRYMAVFTGLTAHDDEIPIDDRFESVLAQSLKVARLSPKDSAFKAEYQLEKDMFEEVESELFSPDEGATIRPRLIPGLTNDFDDDNFEYIGDGNDE